MGSGYNSIWTQKEGCNTIAFQMQSTCNANAIRRAYTLMRAHYGHQHWWPGDTPLEICVGAILTQNTNWKNVEKAIQNLKLHNALEMNKLHALPLVKLAELIRPAGYYNIKAQRLRSFTGYVGQHCGGKLDELFQGSTSFVRKRLLEIKGIGPETADSMLLYAGNHASFVIDAYTKRIFSRHGWCSSEVSYEELQLVCSHCLKLSPEIGADLIDYWQDYHAQLVNIGKDFCRKSSPLCNQCPLKSLLPKGA